MNVFLYEFKSNFKSTLVWSIALGFCGFIFISMYPSFMSDVEALRNILSAYPPEALVALGLGSSIETFNGFYSFILFYIILCGAIQGLIFGISVIAKESSGKTSDFIFTKPLNRTKILINKFLSVFISIVISNITYLIFTYISCKTYIGSIDTKIFLLLQGALFITQILFLTLGFFIGCFTKKIKSPTTVGIGLGSVFFAIEMIANLFEDTVLKYISPMSYINTNYIVKNDSFEISMLILSIFLILLLFILSLYTYKSKDIHAA